MQVDWAAFFGPAAPLIAILGAAAACLLAAAFSRGLAKWLSPAIAFAGIAIAAYLAWNLWPQGPDGGAIAMLSFDRLSFAGWMIVAVAALSAAFLSIPYLEGRRRGDYFSLILLATFGMGVLIAGSDFVAILIGLEVMSLSAYALTGYLKERPSALEGALKYFLMGAFATAFFAMGIAFLFGSTGTTDLATLASRAREIAAGEGRAFFLFGCAMAAVGFSFKVALVPFHAWAPDAYDGAPTPVAALMATGVKAAAFIAFARFAAAVAAPAGASWHHLAFALSAATMIVGNLAAIRQDNLKRMLAYSSIAHAGYILVIFPSIAASPSASMRAVVLYLIAYVAMTAGAFASLVALEPEAGEPVELSRLANLARRRPVLAACFSLFLVSLAGFPPTLGFFGKYYLFLTAVRNGDVLLVCIAVLASVVSVYYYLRPVVVMYFRGGEEKGRRGIQVAPAIALVLAAAAMAVVIFGILPGHLVAFAQATVF